MKLCHHCRISTEDSYEQCPVCGKPLDTLSTAPASAEPPKSKAKAITGFVLSIAGLEASIVGVLFAAVLFTMQCLTLLMMVVDPNGDASFISSFFAGYSVTFCLGMGAYSLAPALVGRFLIRDSHIADTELALVKYGKTLSRIAIILTIVMFSFVFLSVLAGIIAFVCI